MWSNFLRVHADPSCLEVEQDNSDEGVYPAGGVEAVTKGDGKGWEERRGGNGMRKEMPHK